MKRMFVLGALATAAALTAPGAANADFLYPDASYNVGVKAQAPAAAEPEVRATPSGARVTTRLVQRNPDRRVIVGTTGSVATAPATVATTGSVAAAPMTVMPGPYAYGPAYYGPAYYGSGFYNPFFGAPLTTGSIVTGGVVAGPGYVEYAQPELRATPGGGVVRTRVIQRNPTTRATIW